MSLDHDRWEKLLAASESHIDDDGFTARVMTALPRRRSLALRRAILAGSLLAVALSSVLLPPLRATLTLIGSVLASVGALVVDPATTAATIGVPALVAAGVLLVLLTWGAFALAHNEGL